MGCCGTIPRETDTQRKIRSYETAKMVVNSLKAQGKLDDLCRVKAIPIPLYKNTIALVWGNSEIEYGFAAKQIRKISLKKVIKNNS